MMWKKKLKKIKVFLIKINFLFNVKFLFDINILFIILYKWKNEFE